MAESEDTMSDTTVDQTETSAESDKYQTRASAVQGRIGDRLKARNNNRDFSSSTSRY